MKKINIRWMLMLIFLCACTETTKEYKINFSVTLRNHGHLKTGIMVEFRDDKGIKEMEEHLDRIRYSLYLAFSSMQPAKLAGKEGRRKSLNSVKKILRRQLKEEIVTVRFQDFKVTNGT